jgi:hypothetical protein
MQRAGEQQWNQPGKATAHLATKGCQLRAATRAAATLEQAQRGRQVLRAMRRGRQQRGQQDAQSGGVERRQACADGCLGIAAELAHGGGGAAAEMCRRVIQLLALVGGEKGRPAGYQGLQSLQYRHLHCHVPNLYRRSQIIQWRGCEACGRGGRQGKICVKGGLQAPASCVL